MNKQVDSGEGQVGKQVSGQMDMQWMNEWMKDRWVGDGWINGLKQDKLLMDGYVK